MSSKGYNRPAHLSQSADCMRPTLQGLTWFECCELSQEELFCIIIHITLY